MNDLQTIIMTTGKEAEAKLSCLGGRYIQVTGYSGTSGVDALASRVIELVREKKFEFSEEERAIGKIIATRITQLYDASDMQVQNSNCLTRLLRFLRELPDYILGQCSFYPITCSRTRWDWKEKETECESGAYKHAFSYYTVHQYEVRFGHQPARLEELTRYTNPYKERNVYIPPMLVHENTQ